MDYKEDRRVDDALDTVQWLKDLTEELREQNNKLEEKIEELEYEIGCLNGTKQR